jgi:hypothetical protein
VFPVRYELNLYINFLRNSVFKGLIIKVLHFDCYLLYVILLNFGDRTGTGVCNMAWPLAFDH